MRLGVQAQVVVLTQGEAQDAGKSRQAESLAAAAILGNSTVFWDCPDRGIRCSEALVTRLANFIETLGFDANLTVRFRVHQNFALCHVVLRAGHCLRDIQQPYVCGC